MKITKSQLKKIIKEEVEFLEEGVDQDDRRRRIALGDAAREILNMMLDPNTKGERTSEARIIEDIFQILGGEKSHEIMLIIADSGQPPLPLDDKLRNP